MKKKFLSFVLLGCMALSLIACGDTGKEDVQTEKDNGQKMEESGTVTENNGFDYSMVIDGTEIDLPVEYAVLEEAGFCEMGNDTVLDDELEPHTFSRGTYNSNRGPVYGLFTNGTTSNIALIFYNNSDEVRTLRECHVVRIGFEISQRNINRLSVGEVKIVNGLNGTEAVMGTSEYGTVESDFGVHYYADYSNTLTFYPDENGDGAIDISDIDGRYALHMFFDNETGVLDSYDFYYCDAGGFVEAE